MNTQQLSLFFKALSEPVRIRLVALLHHKGELCVCELVDALDLPQSVVSRHLAYLRNAGMVMARRDGIWMHYQIDQVLAENLSTLLMMIEQSLPQCRTLQADFSRIDASCGCN